jgi:hypothetical protein
MSIVCMFVQPDQDCSWKSGISSTSRDLQTCYIMFWILEAFILEKTNLIRKFKRHDPSVNTNRRVIRHPARYVTQDAWSQILEHVFQKSKDCCYIWEVFVVVLAVRRSNLFYFIFENDNCHRIYPTLRCGYGFC